MAQTTEPPRALLGEVTEVEPFESDAAVRFQGLDEPDLLNFEPGPVSYANVGGGAIPELPRSYAPTHGAAMLEERFAEIEVWKQAELASAQREADEARAKAAEVRRRHHVKTLGDRLRAHRGPSRERRPGPCRTSGSRRSRSTSSSRARSPGGDGDPEGEHDARTVAA